MFVNSYIKSKTKWKKKRIGKRCKIYDFLNLKFIKNQSKIINKKLHTVFLSVHFKSTIGGKSAKRVVLVS